MVSRASRSASENCWRRCGRSSTSRKKTDQTDRYLACGPDGLPRFWGCVARGVHLGLLNGSPNRRDDLFEGVAPISPPGKGGAGSLDERPPRWLVVAHSGQARRTRLDRVYGNEQFSVA